MNNDQLDLFDSAPAVPVAPVDTPPVVEHLVMVFPLERRGKVIRTAAATLLSRKTQEGQQSYWNRVVNGLRHELRRLGCSQVEIDRQVASFYAGVEMEIDRLRRGGGDRRSPGGAA